jgi:hypothetical protein
MDVLEVSGGIYSFIGHTNTVQLEYYSLGVIWHHRNETRRITATHQVCYLQVLYGLNNYASSRDPSFAFTSGQWMTEVGSTSSFHPSFNTLSSVLGAQMFLNLKLLLVFHPNHPPWAPCIISMASNGFHQPQIPT